VVDSLAWPSQARIVFKSTPARNRCVAVVCRITCQGGDLGNGTLAKAPDTANPSTLDKCAFPRLYSARPAQASPAAAKLVPLRPGTFVGHGQRPQRRSQAGPQKSLRLQVLRSLRTRLASFTWRSSRARLSPQFLLKSRLFLIAGLLERSIDTVQQ